jgi:hypothetical protein
VTDRGLSRFGAASGALSFIVTFVGFGVHGGLPSDTTTAAIQSYVHGVNAEQTGAGNYLELLGYLLFLVFAAYLYSVARAVGSERLHWLDVLAVTAATTYVAVSAVAIAAQQVMVESSKAGIDAKTLLNVYILDSDAFTMSFEILALFAIAFGSVIVADALPMRVIGGSAILVGALLFVTGLIGTISILSSVAQIGLLLFELWMVAVSIFFIIKPPRIGRSVFS